MKKRVNKVFSTPLAITWRVMSGKKVGATKSVDENKNIKLEKNRKKISLQTTGNQFIGKVAKKKFEYFYGIWVGAVSYCREKRKSTIRGSDFRSS
ncbi:MAG: hypothetical protein AAFV95_23730 [Bacteroidota bacterium]